MTKRQFYDWQTAGGAADVMRNEFPARSVAADVHGILLRSA